MWGWERVSAYPSMLGSTHEQRSNAVGHVPSYLPEVNPGMQGGNTYTGSSSEPTIQDYENVFGPSARDIKTDLQRFKRHGRWHLPDVLKGPNPWLTDRIDGLITDATNSPFTTKILPYMYKEDVDGKMKWNVWSFDEGMASRVPYESAARTLTQSKRSFSGYMVRQGMAIVLEHNFMMSPKGRENFKNQLNQLIGSIQYTNDLDVHMALVLAPSYQKTMREKYFSTEKAPSQICREFCDLFGMMQKNVNALDILIEEGKAILRTWGGPMPDFLLCNSKLTFQMTMTPEKTNYFTQGADGVKRLKQGPDLSSYRGISVIHSRAFAMEAGQHPRDILRRRVRTAEYYRILPHPENVLREFELYNEERDNMFSLTFQDLLRYALVPSSSVYQPWSRDDRDYSVGDKGYGVDNPSLVRQAYNASLSSSSSSARGGVGGNASMLGMSLGSEKGEGFAFLGAVLSQEGEKMIDVFEQLLNGHTFSYELYGRFGNASQVKEYSEEGQKAIEGGRGWCLKTTPFDFGVNHISPVLKFPFWNELVRSMQSRATSSDIVCFPRLTRPMMESLFHSMQYIPLKDPFVGGQVCTPQTPEWYSAFSFYQEVYKRCGFKIRRLETVADIADTSSETPLKGKCLKILSMSELSFADESSSNKSDVGSQLLSFEGAIGSVNNHFHLLDSAGYVEERIVKNTKGSVAGLIARSVLLSYEILEPLLRQYTVGSANPVSGIDYLSRPAVFSKRQVQIGFKDMLAALGAVITTQSLLAASELASKALGRILKAVFTDSKKTDALVAGIEYLCKHGINTWPMGISTLSHVSHRLSLKDSEFTQHRELLRKTFGVLNTDFLAEAAANPSVVSTDPAHPFRRGAVGTMYLSGLRTLGNQPQKDWDDFWDIIRSRLFDDPVRQNPLINDLNDGRNADSCYNCGALWQCATVDDEIERIYSVLNDGNPDDVTTEVADRGMLSTLVIDMNALFKEDPPVKVSPVLRQNDILENVEIVIVRPNIEHNMLGIIMGLGGSELGHTLWGQTELACYDDSMHGIWGMQYKYHERAIVFNEKNLIRLWDIAYDGYNGGKDDTYVDWVKGDDPRNGVNVFREQTLDLSKNYRGPSMMVMAFVHDKKARDPVTGAPVFDSNFRRNWPSPIVFHDVHNPGRQAGPQNETLPLDYDNIQVVDVGDFRVFDSELYMHSYAHYRDLMPSFHELHKMRKTAGQSSAEAETQTDSLAFQGTMRIKQNGRVIQEIQGSGHHGSDYVGVASIRAGKGIKYTGQAPTFSHIV